MFLAWFLLIGLGVGMLVSKLYKEKGSGPVGNLIVGVVGAVVGGVVFGILGFARGGLRGSLVAATVGAVILFLLIRALKR